MSDSEDIEDIREQRRAELQGGSADSEDEPIHLTDADDYESFVADHDVVLVDFHAEWCGPCQMLEPVVEDVADETEATVLKVDIDDHQQLAQEMQVRGVPTLYLYRDGDVAEELVGLQDKETLTSLVDGAV